MKSRPLRLRAVNNMYRHTGYLKLPSDGNTTFYPQSAGDPLDSIDPLDDLIF